MKRITYITKQDPKTGEIIYRITETMQKSADHSLRARALNWIVENVEYI